MIVETDFLDHWKTRMLGDLLGSHTEVPAIMLRLWAHCQLRKTAVFPEMTPNILKALCRYSGEAETLWSALAEAGFVEVNDGVFEVHQWMEVNAGLVRNWKNGAKSNGRPRNNPVTSPTIPSGNPVVTPREPGNNPAISDELDEVDRSDERTPYPLPGGEGFSDSHRSGEDIQAGQPRRAEAPSKRMFTLREKHRVVESEIKAMEEKKKKRGELSGSDLDRLAGLRKTKSEVTAEMMKL